MNIGKPLREVTIEPELIPIPERLPEPSKKEVEITK